MISLMFFIPTAAICTIIHVRKHQMGFTKVLPIAIAGSTTVLLFAAISKHFNLMWIKRAFGVFLLMTAFRELRWRQQK